MSDLERAVSEIRYLLERGYPKQGAITFVCNHHRLDMDIRHIFTRVIYPVDTAEGRKKKTVVCNKIHKEEVWVDGYNTLIGVESALKKDPVYLCDDGFIRDTRGVFRNFRSTNGTEHAINEILNILIRYEPARTEFLFDSQISKSGEMARWVDKKMKRTELTGCARTSKHVDFDLKRCKGIVATSDGGIIDAVEKVVNLQGCVLKQLGIRPIIIEGLIR